jgi:hypothetical protein
MSKLTVVYLKDTGHVLAALTRANPPAAAEPVSALVGTGLPVSFMGGLSLDVSFPAQDLAAVTVDDRPDVVIAPQDYQVVQDPQSQAPPQVNDLGSPHQVTFAITASAGATVAVANARLPARVVLQKATSATSAPTVSAPTVVSQVDIGPGSTVVAGPSGFTAGDTWNMYVLVQGLAPTAGKVTVL